MLKIALLTNKDIERFWSKVDKSHDCWLWLAAKNSHGYGQFRVNGKLYRAPRLAYQIFTGKIPTLFILHTCDNPSCVNPKHLFEGTNQDNMKDMVAKGRNFIRPISGDENPSKKYPNRIARGSKQGLSKLKEDDIPIIRELFRLGKTKQEIADKFKVTKRNITFILQGKTWTHV